MKTFNYKNFFVFLLVSLILCSNTNIALPQKTNTFPSCSGNITKTTNAPYYNPSIIQLYEIFYQSDERFRETIYNSPGIRNKTYYRGIMTNSVTDGSSCTGLLRYWRNDNYFDLMIYEYDLYLVKSYYTQDVYSCTLKVGNNEFNFQAYGGELSLEFDKSGQEYIKYCMCNNLPFKLYIEKYIYRLRTSYLFEIDPSGFRELYDQLNVNQF